jgi:hypothetical protein
MSEPNAAEQMVRTYCDMRQGITGVLIVGFRNEQHSFEFWDAESQHPHHLGGLVTFTSARAALDCIHAADEAWRGFMRRRQRRGGVSA